jgi:hypothetical protein
MRRGVIALVLLGASCAHVPTRLDPAPRLVLRAGLQGDALLCVEQWPHATDPQDCIRVDALRRLLRGVQPAAARR